MNCPRPALEAFVWVFIFQNSGPRLPFEMGSVWIRDLSPCG